MELRRREHELLPPQVGARRVDPREKQDVSERSAVPLKVLAVKEEEKSGVGQLSLDVVDRALISVSDSDSDSNSDSDYDCDGEELLVLGRGRCSMRKGSKKERLTGKKRTAGVLREDLGVDEGERSQVIVDGKESASKKHSGIQNTIIRSEPILICDVVALLNEHQREEVKKIGFGPLLDFRMDDPGPWYLIGWLMDHLNPDDQDPDAMVLNFGANRKLLITQHTVHCVLGLQKGKIDPPLMSRTNARRLHGIPSLREKLGVPADKRIEAEYLLEKIWSGGTDRFTMQCFVMIVFAFLMTCSSCNFIPRNVWSIVNKDFDKYGDMNWCKFIVDQLRYSANKWKEPGGRKKTVYGCPALLVMYYLDNLDCKQKMECVEVPRAKFFGNGMIDKLMMADKLHGEDGLPTFGNLNLRNQMGTRYDERAESSRHVTAHMHIPGTSHADILCTIPMPRNQIGNLAHKSLCPWINKKAKLQHRQLDIGQIEEPEESREENEDGPIGCDDMWQTKLCNASEIVHQQTDGDIAVATQGTTPSLEASVKFHGDPMVPGVPLGENAVTGASEDGYRPVPVDSVQGAVKGQEKDFMAGSSEPEILQRLDSLLPQIRASVASGVRASELQQQVKELTEKLSNKEEELEVTRETLRGAQCTIADAREELQATRAKLRAAQTSNLEAQAFKSEEEAAVAAIKGLACHLGATFVKLGSDPPSGDAIGSCTSLVEAVKLLKDQVQRVEPVSRGHATSLARTSVAFGAAALLCGGREKGIKALHDAVDADTARFVQSQGLEFHAMVDQVVQAVELHHGDVQAGRATRTTAGTSW